MPMAFTRPRMIQSNGSDRGAGFQGNSSLGDDQQWEGCQLMSLEEKHVTKEGGPGPLYPFAGKPKAGL